MSRGVELVLVVRQKIVILPKPKLRVAERVCATTRVRYSELKFN
jgi:hypothetical protein